MCFHFLKLPYLKCNINAVFCWRIPMIKKRLSFRLKRDVLCYVCWLLFFLNNAMDKVYRKQLRRYDPLIKKRHNTLPFCHLVCRKWSTLIHETWYNTCYVPILYSICSKIVKWWVLPYQSGKSMIWHISILIYL